MRRGNEEVCVLEIVRPGMEESESGEKQENTGIGPASACCGESAFTQKRAATRECVLLEVVRQE